ncbi:unnamed protein product, partial [Prorocentrum cordatum]
LALLLQCQRRVCASVWASYQLQPLASGTCLAPLPGHAAVQERAGLKRRGREPDRKAALFQVRGTFRAEHAEPCSPVCRWTCDNPVCEAVCAPVCEPPRCETRCKPFDTSQCHDECSRP